MRKYIAMAVAAGALTVGGAASAQDLGTVISNIFGIGNPAPTYSYGDTPAVVAGTVPYGTQVYSDQYGRQFYYDQYGRQVFVQAATQQYGITGYDAWGRPIYGTTTYGQAAPYGNYAYGNSGYVNPNDRDGDGVPNWRDRYPDDPRYR